jgi:hypothetical protein
LSNGSGRTPPRKAQGLYTEGEIGPILQTAPEIDREATRALVARLYPSQHLVQIEDGTLFEDANPPDHHVYAGCFPGLAVVCTADLALDRPSLLDRRSVMRRGDG